MALKEVNCYNCGSSEYTPYDSENGFNLVKCNGCGLLYVNPRPDEEDISAALKLGIHQGEEVINFTGVYKPFFLDKYAKVLADFFPKEKGELEGKTWLDVGCGYGEFIQALTIHTDGKLKVKGSDPNETKTQYAKSQGLDVGYIDLDTHKGKYDFISFLNVYSHIPEPPQFIEDLKKNLNPGGSVFMQTGHTAHLPQGQHIRPYQLPDHLSFANQEIVENIFHKVGFETVDVHIYRPEWHPYTMNYWRLFKDIVNKILGRRKNPNPILPKHPYQDMFIQFRMKDN
jgi:SAM-dependent methyltransferase